MFSKKQAFRIFSLLAFFILAWTLVFHFVDIESVIETIGVKNGYVVVFIVALIGGVSAFTAVSFYATVAILAGSGFHPMLLALSAMPALIAGDYLFYLIGKSGKRSSSGNLKKFIEKLSDWFNKKPRKYFPLFIYLYSGFTPLPADALMLSMAFLDYPYKKALPFIILGHITFVSLIGFGTFAIFG